MTRAIGGRASASFLPFNKYLASVLEATTAIDAVVVAVADGDTDWCSCDSGARGGRRKTSFQPLHGMNSFGVGGAFESEDDVGVAVSCRGGSVGRVVLLRAPESVVGKLGNFK